jgi:hypothetical protein
MKPQAIRSGAFNQIDIESLAEVADMAREEKRSLRSRAGVLIAHLLAWDYQDRKRTLNWAATIAVQRTRVMMLIEESPSLAPWLSESLPTIYHVAVQLAVKDINMSEDCFPSACPYALDEILTLKEIRF